MSHLLHFLFFSHAQFVLENLLVVLAGDDFGDRRDCCRFVHGAKRE